MTRSLNGRQHSTSRWLPNKDLYPLLSRTHSSCYASARCMFLLVHVPSKWKMKLSTILSILWYRSLQNIRVISENCSNWEKGRGRSISTLIESSKKREVCDVEVYDVCVRNILQQEC